MELGNTEGEALIHRQYLLVEDFFFGFGLFIEKKN